MFLKGTIFITDNIDIIYNIPLNGMNKIINLDEDGILIVDNNNDIIGGQCLLPPMESKIAEADGNVQLYDMTYSSHLLEPFQQKFISALIAYLYKGGNLLLFLPEIGYSNTTEKLIEHLYRIYGIKIGHINDPNPQLANCFYDEKCIPIWLNLIYTAGVISAYEYLYNYPLDANIENRQVLEALLCELNPYGNTINDKINYILSFHKRIHKNPKLQQAICSI